MISLIFFLRIVRIQEIMANNELLEIQVIFCIQAQLPEPRLAWASLDSA
jgi:hypothetical protein